MNEKIQDLKTEISIILNDTNAYNLIDKKCIETLKQFDIEEFAVQLEEQMEIILEELINK